MIGIPTKLLRSTLATTNNFVDFEWFKLSYNAAATDPTWGATPPTFGIDREVDYADTPAGYRIEKICCYLHDFTHMDAPAHFIQGGKTTDQIPLQNLYARGLLIDLSNRITQLEGYTVTRNDIIAFEQSHNLIIRENTIVMIRTGWDKHWEANSKKYGDFNVFPCLSPEAATYLAEKNVYGVGTDTPSVDRAGNDETYPAHHIILGKGLYLLEKLNLSALANHFHVNRHIPPLFDVRIAPLPLKDTAEAPVNVLALVPK